MGPDDPGTVPVPPGPGARDYERPAMPESSCRSADGTLIPYGHRWGDEGADLLRHIEGVQQSVRVRPRNPEAAPMTFVFPGRRGWTLENPWDARAYPSFRGWHARPAIR